MLNFERMEIRHYFWLATTAAVLTIVLKTLAWWTTGSVGLLSDAMESFVNLAGATFALWMVTIAKSPPDDRHQLGHGKAEYFSAGFEGILILGAAAAIIWSASLRLVLRALSMSMCWCHPSGPSFKLMTCLTKSSSRFNEHCPGQGFSPIRSR